MTVVSNGGGGGNSNSSKNIQLAVSPASTSSTIAGGQAGGTMRPLSSASVVQVQQQHQSPLSNPMPHRLPEGENAAPLEVIGTTASDKLVIIMVGLPATGT